MNKRNLILIPIILFTALPVGATTLIPGQGNVPFSPYAGGGTLLVDASTSATTATFAGTIREAVYRAADGTLDFLYQLTNSGPGTHTDRNGKPSQTSIERMSAYSFDGFTVDAELATTAFGPFATVDKVNDATASRKFDGTISVNFPENDGVLAGETSPIYAFRTNATTYIAGTAQLIDGSTLDATQAFAPGAVPEPSSWALMVVGLGGIGAAIRLRRTKRNALVFS